MESRIIRQKMQEGKVQICREDMKLKTKITMTKIFADHPKHLKLLGIRE